MADREAEILARIAGGVCQIDPAEWNALAGRGDPFLSHAFLSLLETSGSVGDETGWTPLPIMVERSGRITAAAPAYLKTHSQGEYVFDHGWADAWERAGGTYYPKLQVTVPFTPCVGQRLLGADRNALLAALETVTIQNTLSSAHITFLTDEESRLAEARGWLRRDGLQYHWFNRGYAGFDDFLGALSSRKRKAIRKERAAAMEGLEIVALRGANIGPKHWQAMWRFYQHTGARKWGR
ncbi:MAG: peptidogalycan biosysnthesis protein, partial [Sphingomicrobium sp.]